MGGSVMMVVSGIVFFFTSNYYLLLFAAIIGIVTPGAHEVGPFRALQVSHAVRILFRCLFVAGSNPRTTLTLRKPSGYLRVVRRQLNFWYGCRPLHRRLGYMACSKSQSRYRLA
jgi:hypothetical protein